MPRVDVNQCPTCGQPRGEPHKIITKRPARLSLFHLIDNNMVRATDNCWTTAAGMCQHGHYSWAVIMKMVEPSKERRTIPFFKRSLG